MRRWIFIAALSVLPLCASAQTFDAIRVYGMGGKSMTNWHGQADIQALHLELGRALSPRTTLALVASPMNIYQPRSWFGDLYGDGAESVRAVAASALLRQTFRNDSRLPFYAEASFGPMWAQKRVPAATSHFNFISHAGAGIILNARGRTPIMLGYRFMHISNAGYAPRNPGLNVSAIVAGVQFRTSMPRRQ
jgi:lipid A 3-O-deacylase